MTRSNWCLTLCKRELEKGGAPLPIQTLGKIMRTRPRTELRLCTRIILVAALLNTGFLISGAGAAFPAQLGRAPARHRSRESRVVTARAGVGRCVFFVDRTDHASWIREYWNKREVRSV